MTYKITYNNREVYIIAYNNTVVHGRSGMGERKWNGKHDLFSDRDLNYWYTPNYIYTRVPRREFITYIQHPTVCKKRWKLNVIVA